MYTGPQRDHARYQVCVTFLDGVSIVVASVPIATLPLLTPEEYETVNPLKEVSLYTGLYRQHRHRSISIFFFFKSDIFWKFDQVYILFLYLVYRYDWGK